MKIKALIEECLQNVMQLQIATTVDSIPWIATVCYAYDSNFNLYWFSRHNTRHSKEISLNPHVAAALSFPYAIGDKPRGLQFIGIAKEIHDKKSILQGLKALKGRYKVSPRRIFTLRHELLSHIGDYGLYQLRPESIVLYDTLNFPDSPRQVYIPHVAVKQDKVLQHPQAHQ